MPALITLSKKLFLYLVIFLVVVIGVIAGINRATNSQASEALLDRALDRQLKLNKTGAVVISQFINLSAKSLSLMHKYGYELTCNPASCHDTLVSFANRWENSPILDIGVSDKNDILVDNYNFDGISGIGTDLSQRDYLHEVKKLDQGEVHISRPIVSLLGITKDKYIFTLSTPLYESGEYSGAVIVAIQIEDFIKQYFDFAQDDDHHVFLLDKEGYVLVASQNINEKNDYLIGKNVFELLNENSFYNSDVVAEQLKEMIGSNTPQSNKMLLPEALTGKIKNNLVTSAPVSLTNSRQGTWTLIIMTPPDSVLSHLAPIYIEQITWLVIVFFLLLFFVMSMMKLIEIRAHETPDLKFFRKNDKKKK